MHKPPTVVFTAANKHSASCGEPPGATNAGHDDYFGYFENQFGEQWLFVFDRREKRPTLRGGDTGWEKVYEVVNGRPIGIGLDAQENAWLQACLNAAHGINR